MSGVVGWIVQLVIMDARGSLWPCVPPLKHCAGLLHDADVRPSSRASPSFFTLAPLVSKRPECLQDMRILEALVVTSSDANLMGPQTMSSFTCITIPSSVGSEVHKDETEAVCNESSAQLALPGNSANEGCEHPLSRPVVQTRRVSPGFRIFATYKLPLRSCRPILLQGTHRFLLCARRPPLPSFGDQGPPCVNQVSAARCSETPLQQPNAALSHAGWSQAPRRRHSRTGTWQCLDPQ